MSEQIASPIPQVSFIIKDIQIASKSLNVPRLKEGQELPEFAFKIQVEIGLNDKAKNSVHVVSVEIAPRDNQDEIWANISVACVFEIYNWEEIIERNDLNLKLRDDVAELLNMISIGTLRGILFSEMRGTVLHNAILPVLDIKSFVKGG